MAVGGVFGVMNTMFAAISQRIKDIGVLRILGFARWQILVSFFLESLVLALVGGLLGCALGSLADGWTATSIVCSGQGGGKSVVLSWSSMPTSSPGHALRAGDGAAGRAVAGAVGDAAEAAGIAAVTWESEREECWAKLPKSRLKPAGEKQSRRAHHRVNPVANCTAEQAQIRLD